MQIHTVGALTQYLKDLFDSDTMLRDVWVEGEISNFNVSPAGHAYFTMKDASSQLRCALFRGRFGGLGGYRPASGDAVIAHGRISIYEAQGSYQLYVDLLRPQGLGELFLRFELLRGRLEQEGLFDTSRKRSLPAFPHRIGIVTSPTGAVLHDIIDVVSRRYPFVELLLSPTMVQGDRAAEQICAAIEALNDHNDVDVIIVARGGGSLEDLWAFNEETVARAIYGSRVPVITGVGHETDFTIADFVADVRAPTPSAAAELVVPDRREYQAAVRALGGRLGTLMARHLQREGQAVAQLARRLERSSPGVIIDRRRQQADELGTRARTIVVHRAELLRARVEARALQLQSLDPMGVLERGYSICTVGDRVVKSVGQVGQGDEMSVRVSDGQLVTRVER